MFDKMKEPYSAPNKNHKEMHGENHSKKVGSQNWYKDVVVSLVWYKGESGAEIQ